MALNALRSPRTIVIAEGARHSVGHHAAALGASAILITDERCATTQGFADILTSLTVAGVDVAVYASTQPELPSEQVAEVAAMLGEREIVIGVGGGSCIDLAKAAAVIGAYSGTIADYYGENRVPGPVLPIIAVPTTAGTGAEVTPVAVISDGATGIKSGVSSPRLIPEVALVDPELTYTCPAGLTAAVGADALCHLVESYTAIPREQGAEAVLSKVFLGAGELTAVYGREGLRLADAYLERAVRDGSDVEARGGMARAATYGGLALGTAGTAAAHALQYPIGALTHTPHGVGVGILLPYVMRFNRSHARAAFAELGAVLGAPTDATVEQRADHAIHRITEILHAIGIPKTLAEIGMSETDLPAAVTAAMRSERLIHNNPRPLDEAGVQTLFSAALTGDESSLAATTTTGAPC